MTQLFWIEGPWHGRLAISARPPGGDWLADEMIDWRHAGVGTVVSLLAAEEIQDLELIREEPLCRAAGMEFVSMPNARSWRSARLVGSPYRRPKSRGRGLQRA